MKIWIDSYKRPPSGYIWCKNIKHAIESIKMVNDLKIINNDKTISKPSIDCIDLGFVYGVYDELFKWFKDNSLVYDIHIHTINVSLIDNIRKLIKEYNFKEI